MAKREAIRADDVARATDAAREHPEAARLGAFVFDVLSRQAEGGALLVGHKHVDKRATEHGVTEAMGETPQGNVLSIVTRGPDTPRERALVAAFALVGLGEELSPDAQDQTGHDGVATLVNFVRHADWLEVATPLVIYPFVDEVLGQEAAGRVWSAVADACVSARPDSLSHGAHGAAALRVSALAASSSAAAREGLGRIARHAASPALRAAASFAIGDDGHAAPEEGGRVIRVSGRAGRVRHKPVLEALRYLSGWAFLAQAFRLASALVGVQRPVELRLIAGGVEVRQQVTWFSRIIREQEEVVPTAGILRLRRDVRFPAIHLLVGMLFLSVGVLVGGALAVDAARSGSTWLFLVAAGLVLVGAGVDFALDVLVPAKRGRIAVELAPRQGPPRRVEGVTVEGAEKFLGAVRQRLN